MKANLKVIEGGRGRYPRNVIAELDRGIKVNRAGDYNRRMIRRYSTPERALMGACRWMIQVGYVHDVITVYREESGRVYGTVKVTLKGRIKVEWGTE